GDRGHKVASLDSTRSWTEKLLSRLAHCTMTLVNGIERGRQVNLSTAGCRCLLPSSVDVEDGVLIEALQSLFGYVALDHQMMALFHNGSSHRALPQSVPQESQSRRRNEGVVVFTGFTALGLRETDLLMNNAVLGDDHDLCSMVSPR